MFNFFFLFMENQEFELHKKKQARAVPLKHISQVNIIG